MKFKLGEKVLLKPVKWFEKNCMSKYKFEWVYSYKDLRLSKRYFENQIYTIPKIYINDYANIEFIIDEIFDEIKDYLIYSDSAKNIFVHEDFIRKSHIMYNLLNKSNIWNL